MVAEVGYSWLCLSPLALTPLPSLPAEPPLVVLRPNKYDHARANLAIFNWSKQASVDVDASSFLRAGDEYRLMNPRDFFGKPALEGKYTDTPISVPMEGEFAAFVLIKESTQ